ncbi:MFS general substrate transporter [Phlegmacium glaucopus]|nr:MFS general substrate transporter [Phlegmacium glaucopus]
MAEFHINFMFSSLLYAGSTIGFLTGTLLVESIINQLGRFSPTNVHWSWFLRMSIFPEFLSSKKPRKVIGYSPSKARFLALLLSSCLHGMFFVMMGSHGGYWVSFCAYALAAFARSILCAALNAYFASSLKQSLGYAYGLWSLGAVASPLVCQAIIAIGIPWSHFYLGSLVLSAFNVVFLVITFRPTPTEFLRDQENALIVTNRLAKDSEASNVEASSPIRKSESEAMSMDDQDKSNTSTLRRTLSFPYQWAVSVFALLYCGCETTTQSFMVTYLLGTRHADRKTVGYVTSGFWGGITIGRLLWGHYTAKLTYTQRKLIIQGCIRKIFAEPRGKIKLKIYPVIGLTMQLLIWFVNSNVQNAFFTSIIGLVYGPIFPAALTLANDILPPDICMVSMAFISASASFGAALFPFVAGLVSSIKGIHTLTFITVPLAIAIACLWFLFPSKIPHRTSIV